jgi:hypothetical protein
MASKLNRARYAKSPGPHARDYVDPIPAGQACFRKNCRVFEAGMWRFAATAWVGAATGDRRHGGLGAATGDRGKVSQIAKLVFGEFRLLEDGTKGSGGNIPGVHR